ncbi:MAG TPA: hypothetical protein VNT99_14825 [Methylomirabilota bacterium]|nr:hypothetical protein [Methylomirabilota bacterium]
MNAAPLDRAAIRRDLQDFSLAGLDRRLGPDYASYRSNGPAETLPNVWMAPSRQDPGGRRYQLGGPWVLDPGMYSSTQGQTLFAPEPGNFGVDRVTVLEWANGCFSERPEPPWWGGFRPEPVSQSWINAAGGNPGSPIAMARAMGGWANCGVILFSSGLVGSAGTCTAWGTNPTWQFPPGKVLTAVAVTSKSEFALVTICDVKSKKGQLAVLALQGGGWSPFVHDWSDPYPCLPSTAWLSGMKLLGYIDLPGVEFPTAVAAAGNDVNRWVFGPDRNVGYLAMWNPSQQPTRDSFRTGQNAGFVSTAGYAVVISKHENKAVFIDLQPLFKRVSDLHFTTPENFQKTRNLGPGPTQWPYTFDADPAWKPAIVKVIDVPQPTAVVASLSRGNRARAYIASMDGTVGGYQLGGLANTSNALPGQIVRVSNTQVGRNPTCLTQQKFVTDTIMAVSRGDREIAWIKDDLAGTRVIRRLRDARMLDPVAAEMADTMGIEASIITVADFRGRKILNYRFGRVVFELQGGAIFGMGPAGLDEFECGGTLDFPGSPFCISATNVN